MYRLRFDVETISKATNEIIIISANRLRFDVETISKATTYGFLRGVDELRFDVETISKATVKPDNTHISSCGLM